MARSARPRTHRKRRRRYLLQRLRNKRLLLQHILLLSARRGSAAGAFSHFDPTSFIETNFLFQRRFGPGINVYPTIAKFRPHPGQSVKTGSSLTAMRRLFPEMSDECLVYTRLRCANRRSGLYRSVVGSYQSRVVRVCDHRPVLGCWSLRPMLSGPFYTQGRVVGSTRSTKSFPRNEKAGRCGPARRHRYSA
jgi:hypothetical protein